MTYPIRAALERLIARIEETHNPDDPVPAWFDSYFAARAALAEPLPPKVGHIQRLADIIEECQPKTPYVIAATALAQAILSHPDIRLVLANSDGPDWPARLRNCPTHGQQPPQAWGCPECVRQLREELAAARLHQPIPSAEGEVPELVDALSKASDGASAMGLELDSWAISRAATLLQQQEAEINRMRAQQAPVPVSERLPGPKDLSTKLKYCWWFDCVLDSWDFCDASYCDHGLYTHWLPAHALPMPQGEVEK